MARIKIKDLPREQKISKEKLRKIKGADGSVRFIGVEGKAGSIFNPILLNPGVNKSLLTWDN